LLLQVSDLREQTPMRRSWDCFAGST
jgi:hypothetical protein